ncbi:hypothetical protein HVPorG_04982 [Roseomonas mucosa]|nr:hypothetical protein HVPorG_04982 [Roseomonas mucosa]
MPGAPVVALHLRPCPVPGEGSAFPPAPHPPGAGGSWTCQELAPAVAGSRRRVMLSGDCRCRPCGQGVFFFGSPADPPVPGDRHQAHGYRQRQRKPGVRGPASVPGGVGAWGRGGASYARS